MKRICLLATLVLFLSGCNSHDSLLRQTYEHKAAYMQARQQLISTESAFRFDAGIKLSLEEQKANRRLLELKRQEIKRTQGCFPPAHNFLKSKHLIDNSPVLEVMKRMPKGGILHAHTGAMVDFRWFVSYATYLPNCYIHTAKEGKGPVKGSLRFFRENPGEGWQLVSGLRKTAENTQDFDKKIYQSFTLGEEDLNEPDIWVEFEKCFERFIGLPLYLPVYKQFCRKMLEEMIAENVQYAEFRGLPGGVYDLDGTIYDMETCLDIFQGILNDIRLRHPDLNVKFIGGCLRTATRKEVGKRLQHVLELREKHPDLVIGFDLVCEEDKTHTNLYYIDELLNAQKEGEKRGIALPFYLHSGESNRPDDENLYDAILLNSRRIGHGFALVKHPLLMRIVKERDIAIEVCPISNQVMGYIGDLRNHPAVHYINDGLAVVLCPDDPGVMQHTFSHDYYEAFMAWGLDLKSLKQLAINSLSYSAMNETEKERALKTWEEKWNKFIAWVNIAQE